MEEEHAVVDFNALASTLSSSVGATISPELVQDAFIKATEDHQGPPMNILNEAHCNHTVASSLTAATVDDAMEPSSVRPVTVGEFFWCVECVKT